jgi:hypothetical protein
MANKKKLKKKSKKSAGRKVMPEKKKRATATKSAATKSGKKAAPKKAAAKKKASKKSEKKKTAGAKKAQTADNRTRSRSQERRPPAFTRETSSPRSGEQSGDLQGLSDIEGADSESVDELLEEGNAFEAGVVGGVEDAGAHEGGEVHTHEVPEDDVPGEYLDNDDKE